MKSDEKRSKKLYEDIAGFYHNFRTKENPKGWFYNELLEMPASLEILGKVKGKRVLDYGCGTGIYAKILVKKGAKVKGFDISEEMLKIARKDNPNLDLRQGTGYKIPFKEKFDVVLAPLVVHYMEDWNKMFREVSRVLKKGGDFIFSTGNPVYESNENVRIGKKKYKVLGINSYFKQKHIKATWTHPTTKKKVQVVAYHRTYEEIIKTILRHGFEIVDYKDCHPIKKAKKLFPDDYDKYSKMPIFMVFKVRKK